MSVKHRCKLCEISKDIESGPLTKRQRAAIEHLWSKAEAAETDLTMMALHATDDNEFFFEGKVWVPKKETEEAKGGPMHRA